MKTGDIARKLGVSSKTVRDWVIEFSEHFSESKTKQRIYTAEDYAILATIAKYSHEGHNLKSIREKLEDGERVSPEDDITYGLDTRMVPAASVEQMIDATEIRISLERVTYERDKLFEDMRGLQQKLEDQRQAYETKLESQRQTYESKMGEMEKDIRKMLERIGRAEAQAELLRDMLEGKLGKTNTLAENNPDSDQKWGGVVC